MTDITKPIESVHMSSAAPEALEDIFLRLDALISGLESEGASLEKALLQYEEGITLTRKAQNLVSTAEQRLRVLQADSESIESGIPSEKP